MFYKQIILLLVVSLTLFATSCSESNNIVGCWKNHHSDIYNFSEDGSLSVGMRTGSWQLIDDRLILTVNGLNDSDEAKTSTNTIVKLTSETMIIKYNGVLEFTWSKVDCE